VDHVRPHRLVLLDEREGISCEQQKQHSKPLPHYEGKRQPADERGAQQPHAALSM
jgi:hypothetical protein